MNIKSVCLILVCTILLTGCAKKNEIKTTIAPQPKDNSIALLIRNTQEPFLQEYLQNVVHEASEKNVVLKIMDAVGDESIQIDQLDALIAQGVTNYIVLAQSEALTETIADKVAAVNGSICFSNTPPTIAALKKSTRFYYASSPEISCGRIQANLLNAYFTAHPTKLKGKNMYLLLLEGKKSHPAQKYRRFGLTDELTKLGYSVNIVASQYADWSAALAQPIMDRWLSTYRGAFNAVVTENDSMALGAIASLVDKKYTDTPDGTSDKDGDNLFIKVPVVGADGTNEAIDAMKHNMMYATVLQDSKLQSSTALSLILECMKNGTAVGYTTPEGISAPT